MSINRHKNHLTVYLEDKPYRDIMNGIKNSLHINDQLIDVKNPSGGWLKVFEDLRDNAGLINKYEYMHVLLLIDFDNQYDKRIEQFSKLVNEVVPNAINRIFLLGVDQKQSEDLKTSLGHQNYEKIGTDLVDACHHQTPPLWQSPHLKCNVDEIEKIRSQGVFAWLFKANQS